MSTLAQQVLAAAAFLAAIAGIVKVLHLHEIGRGLLIIVRDWRGDPARPGYEGRPSMPERIATLEDRTRSLNHDMRDDLGGRLALVEELLTSVQTQTRQLERNGGSHLADTVHTTAESVTRLEEGVLDLSHRVTDVSAKADAVSARAEALGERQETLRAADQQLALDLQHFIETKYADLLTGNEALRAALNEALSIDEP